MDAKLKSLKVTDLKEILSKASIPPGNAKKQDLINKILANPAAIDVFYALHPAATKPDVPLPPHDDLLAPPEEVDWMVEEVIPTPSKSTQQQLPSKPSPKSKQPPAPAPAPAPEPVIVPPPSVQSTSTKTLAPTEDEEAVKRKARAARFNIDYVEPKESSPRRQKKEKISIVSSSDGPEKLKARAERFGISMTKTTGKRKVPVDQDQIDPEEQERRKKRAERFGQIPGTKA